MLFGGRRSRIVALLALTLFRGAYNGLAQTSATDVKQRGVLPLYERAGRRAGPAESMIYGPGYTDGSSIVRPMPHGTLNLPGPRCSRPPQEAELQAYASLQEVTPAQAGGLGIVLHTRNGANEPFRGGPLAIWRVGRYAACSPIESGGAVVYGAEWVAAFLLAPGVKSPATLADLEAVIASGRVVEFGSTVNGAVNAQAIRHDLQEVEEDWKSGDKALLARFSKMTAKWPAAALQTDLTAPLGSVRSSAGN